MKDEPPRSRKRILEAKVGGIPNSEFLIPNSDGWVGGWACPATLLPMDGYPFVCPIQVRWRDLDAFAHVNNATFATYMEIARTAVWRERFCGRKAMGIPFFVKRLEIDYKQSVSLYDDVRVGLRVGVVKGASFTFEYRVEADGAVAAEAITLLACVDNTSGKPHRIDPGLRTTLESLIQFRAT
jgi:acyl-CoA thioester hydrolase